MISDIQPAQNPIRKKSTLRNLPGWLSGPLPLFMLQPVLRRLMQRMAHERADLFERLGTHKDKTYLIQPTNLPFMFVLHPGRRILSACRPGVAPRHDAKIKASLLTLIDMVDGRLDGDALFFNRHLVIEGDIEAVVVLRNALDDLDGSIVDTIAGHFGAPARAALSVLRLIRKNRHERKSTYAPGARLPRRNAGGASHSG
jgi:predicted lipid carrier protein YhbT